MEDDLYASCSESTNDALEVQSCSIDFEGKNLYKKLWSLPKEAKIIVEENKKGDVEVAIKNKLRYFAHGIRQNYD